METSGLLVNLVFALVAALGGALIAARLGQSVILGYIVAGIAIGPFTPGFVGDIETVEALAEIGIILLMFAIGIQFSLRELLRAGRVATVGSTIQVLLTIGIGTAVGLLLGWRLIEALFFGAVISNSSSTVLSKVLGERGELDSVQGRLALAWSTMQDLGTIVLIVLLSALATDSDALARDLALEVGKAVIFLVLVIPIGLRVLPWLFSQVAGLRNREVFVLTVAVVALGLAYSASFFGLSLALGAFVAGVVVSESDLSHQILGEVLPLRDIFAGLFFVSVGMLVDPEFVVRHLPLLLLTLVLIVVVKGGMTALLAGWLGTPTRAAVLTGAILAQSAEFSFLLARVGRDVGAVSTTVFSLMLAGAAASIVVLPGVYQGAQPLAAALGARRPTFRIGADSPSPTPDEPALSGHAVICGYGRVGAVVGRVIGKRFTCVAIDEDPRIVERLRNQGVRAIQGNAAIPTVLERANPGRARVLIVALPDPVAIRQIVAYVRERYPGLDVVVRTHSELERLNLIERGVDEVVLGEWELALELTRHTLHRFGVGALEVQEVIQRLRHRRMPAPMAAGRNPAAPPHVAAPSPRRPRLVKPERTPGSRRPGEIERQRHAVAEGVDNQIVDRTNRFRNPAPAGRRSNGRDVDQPEHDSIQAARANEDIQGAPQASATRQQSPEQDSEGRTEQQMDEAAGHRRWPERRLGVECGRTEQEGDAETKRPNDTEIAGRDERPSGANGQDGDPSG